MIRNLAWNTFKNTGNINTFLELLEVENIEKDIKVKPDGNAENKRNSNCWKIYEWFWQNTNNINTKFAEKLNVQQKEQEEQKVLF